MNTNYAKDKTNVLAKPPTLEEVDAATYGAVDIPDSNIIRARPVSIMDVWPDVTQPRRAIPAAVRGEWRGDPAKALEVLETWRIAAEQAGGMSIDVTRHIMAHGDGAIGDGRDGNWVLSEYLELLSLAASILRDGLLNPISVVQRGQSYLIETGERRWLAYHLLRKYADPAKYDRIPARLRDRVNVWQQAAENGARRPLNAIGMSRQLALLIMDMYKGDPGEHFDRYEECLIEGSDRRFYAQVANGNVYRIKRGMGQRILDVTGLKSTSQVAQYRALLSISDALWLQADLESWTEGRIREEVKPEVEDTNTFTVVNVSDEIVPAAGRGVTSHDDGWMTPSDRWPSSTPRDAASVAPPPVDDNHHQYLAPPVEVPYHDSFDAPTADEPPAHPDDGQPVVDRLGNVAAFLDALLDLNYELDQNPHLLNAITNLLRMSREEISRSVAPGDADVYMTMLNSYYDLIAEFIQTRMEELNAFVDELWHIGVELSGGEDA